MMKLRKSDLAINERNMVREISRFIEFTGESDWRYKIEQIVAYKKGHPYSHLTEFIQLKNPLVEPLVQYFILLDQGKSIWKHKTNDILWLASTAVAINRIAHLSSDRVKKRIKSNILDDNLAESFLFEVKVATHYLINNYEIIFNDLTNEDEQITTFDLLIKKESFEAEIECKRINYDTDRKITRIGFCYLINEILPKLLDLSDSYVIGIKAENRLDIDHNKFRNIANELRKNINETNHPFEIEGVKFNIDKIPEAEGISNNEAKRMLLNYRKVNAHGYVIRHDNSVIIITAESERKDRVIDKIYRILKKASKQLSGNRPSFIVCFIEDVDEIDWELLKENSAIANMTNAFLEEESVEHVNIVTYSSKAVLQVSQGVMQFSAQNLYFKNHESKYKDQSELFLTK